MCISSFDDDDIEDVLRRANSTEFGLAAGVFSKVNKDSVETIKIPTGMLKNTLLTSAQLCI